MFGSISQKTMMLSFVFYLLIHSWPVPERSTSAMICSHDRSRPSLRDATQESRKEISVFSRLKVPG